jgi:hypothetical protein
MPHDGDFVISSLMIVARGEPLSPTYFEMFSAVFARSPTDSQRRVSTGVRLYRASLLNSLTSTARMGDRDSVRNRGT